MALLQLPQAKFEQTLRALKRKCNNIKDVSKGLPWHCCSFAVCKNTSFELVNEST